ncbi:MAG: AMMECR1 domain-containing protein [Firmicutes bacterium HGW-Firmicutes-14]|nr:MAG: AMMECR1 domain-containing protein [Firmicutes bacterium HGW-Firmicutes-14]
MGNIVFYGLAPHPPILLPEVGGRESEKVNSTFSSMEEFAGRVAASGAEILVIISPHGSVFSDGVAINGSKILSGDLRMFRADLEFEYNNDHEMIQEIIEQARQVGITAVEIDDGLAGEYGISVKLDHGVLVPIYFFNRAGIDLPIVSISMSMLPFEELYMFGFAVKKAVETRGCKAAVVASGDMSHRLTREAPAGYSPEGELFDRKIVELLKNKDFRGVINIDRNMAESAGECGLRTLIMMLGAMDGEDVDAEVLSYEGPFGVGYLVAAFTPTGRPAEGILAQLFEDRREKTVNRRKGESIPVTLARNALEAYVKKGRRIVPDTDEDTGLLLEEQAGVFVSLKKQGQLRGCIGTVMPTTDNIGQEIVQNAISAGTRDPRFNPVREDELDELVYSVDILRPPERIQGPDQLDVKRYGVIVRSGRKSGLLLPNLEGINTVEEQVEIARQKAGISPGEPVELERFEVIRYY